VRPRQGRPVDGFDAGPRPRRLLQDLEQLIHLLQALTQQQGPTPLVGGGDTFTPSPATPDPVDVSPSPTPTPAPAPSPAPSPAGGGCSQPNPFNDGKGMVLNGTGYQFAKPGPDMTWDQLAKLFEARLVSANTSGSCGMTQAERSESLRSYWDQCVKSGKSPAECSFNLLCSPTNPPPGIVVG
jgi:hypothetical protein